ncbi:hypothetical protein [Pseudomonas synxantha]|uniref:hypothetical protein n=1 Tax=Pseudomonas TaxID=286 RepID=UPI002790F457|nr:hypothetical protein [Pseudomonas synxantha]MDQ0982684.1 hypothetical protein [Pseudomonas synxantha]
MSNTPSANPLIKTDQASTIDAINYYIELLCIQKANDDTAHPGEALQLETLRQAIVSLRKV